MISYEEAVQILAQFHVLTGIEPIDATQSLGRVLAGDLTSDIDMPRFNRATMDGFAIHSSDIKNTLDVVETIPAGSRFTDILKKGQALRIMTGAPVPDGCDMVVPIEQSHPVGENKVRFEPNSKTNISPQGEDFKAGDILLQKGQLIKPRHIALMAAIGCTNPLVYKQPKVSIIASGNELIEPANMPVGAQIRNTNSWLLSALISKTGGINVNSCVVGDEMPKTLSTIENSIDKSDILLITGGVSAGDYDLIPQAIESLGGKLIIRKINIQPGKPITFAVLKEKPVFGIPGNPVAAFVTFELFIDPFLNQMMGNKKMPLEILIPLEDDFKRGNSQRKGFFPVQITAQSTIRFLKYHGSGHLSSLIDADGLAIIDQDINLIKKGESVRVRLL